MPRWIEYSDDLDIDNPIASFIQLLAEELCKAFKDKRAGDLHQKAGEILEKFNSQIYEGIKPELAGDQSFINQIAGALYAAAGHIGEFDLIS